MYALILDDAAPPRHEARGRVDAALERPFNAGEAELYDAELQREAWHAQYLAETTSPDQVAQTAKADALLGAVTYGE